MSGDQDASEGTAGSAESLQLGRFVLIDLLGEGAMGRVMAAYDPDLDRKVAIKLLRPSGATANATRERLLREARAMARVSHPNVLQVHEVGTVDDRVFIVMEHAASTFREWCAAERRDWRDVLDRMTQAAHGLAAAHAVGLIHRDFKPDNVLLMRDGRVRVADFGLVSVGGAPISTALPADRETTAGGKPSLDQTLPSPNLTVPGQLLGTPMYMAPEQYLNDTVGPAADQFAFCITLYEALYNEYPFNRDSFGELYTDIVETRVKPPPADSPVPRWLQRVVLRGLSKQPDERFPSMAALADALADDPDARKRKRRMVGALGAGFVALSGLAVFGFVRDGAKPAQCEASDAASAVWSPEARARVEAAFVATKLPHARDTFTRVAAQLDERARVWSRARVEACRARARGEQSPDLVDRRMHCLDRSLAGMTAVVDVLGGPLDRGSVDRAVQAVLDTPAPAQCADTAALLVAHPEPRDPMMKLQLDAVRTLLDRARALTSTGQFAKSVDFARPAVERARTIQYRPLLAQALARLAQCQQHAGEYAVAEATAREGLRVAAEANDDRLRSDLSVRLLDLVGHRQARHAEARMLADVAEADIARAGNPPEARAVLIFARGVLEADQGNYDKALAHFLEWRALDEKAGRGESPDYAHGLATIADLHETLGQLDKALPLHERALAIRERMLGAQHPHVADSLNNMGVVLFRLGRIRDADTVYRRSLAIREQVLGAEHPLVASTLNNLAGILEAEGRFEETLPLYDRALAIRTKALGPNHPRVALIYNNLGETLVRMERLADAQAAFAKSLAIREAKLGAQHPDLAPPLMNLARVLARSGKHADGETHARRALALWEKAFGANHTNLAYPRAALVEIYLTSGRTKQALPLAESVLATREKAKAEPVELAEARFFVARAVADPARARTLAEAARDGYAAAGAGRKRELAEVEAWLAKHPAPQLVDR